MTTDNRLKPDSSKPSTDAVEVALEHHEQDKQVFQTLLLQHPTLRRRVEKLEDGIAATFLSDKPEIVQLLQDHAPLTHRRLSDEHCKDELCTLYDQLSPYLDDIQTRIETIEKGVSVVETTRTTDASRLLHKLSDAIGDFIAISEQQTH